MSTLKVSADIGTWAKGEEAVKFVSVALKRMAKRIENGEMEGDIWDTSGNTIEFRVEFVKEE